MVDKLIIVYSQKKSPQLWLWISQTQRTMFERRALICFNNNSLCERIFSQIIFYFDHSRQ